MLRAPASGHGMRTFLLIAWLLAVSLLAWSSQASTPHVDAWGIRVSGAGSTLRFVSLSEANVGKPPLASMAPAREIARRGDARVSILLSADAGTAAWLQARPSSANPELDQAQAWLQRLRGARTLPAKIELTLVEPDHRLHVQRVHGAAEGIVVDLVVPAPAAGARSAAIGKALGIALHEASHAITALAPAGSRPDRHDDEYRASLVETCYRIDTLRIGDTLHLAPRAAADAGEYFVTAQSRDAAREVVEDLARAAGSRDIRGSDGTALLGLKLACGVGLAHP